MVNSGVEKKSIVKNVFKKCTNQEDCLASKCFKDACIFWQESNEKTDLINDYEKNQ